jgi:hypothetical protein
MTQRPPSINRRHLLAGSAALGATMTLPQAGSSQESTPESAASSSVPRLPEGYALVTSIRLPLAGISSVQEAPLIQGAITNWREVGAPVSRPVTPITIDGLEPSGMTPAQKVADYAELITVLDADAGAMAVVPVDQIDFQVNTLRVDGVDPLLATGTDDAPVVRIGAAGDIIPGRNVANYIRNYDDFTMPLQRVKSVLADFDITFANFECFISETLESPELTDAGALDFLTRPQFVPALVDAGIDAVSMANNHAVYSHSGWGLPAFADTYTYLNQGGVPVFGAGMDLDQARAPWIGEANGLSVALLGIDGITGNLDYPDSPGVVVNARSQATADHGGTNPLHMEAVAADISRLALLPYE